MVLTRIPHQKNVARAANIMNISSAIVYARPHLDRAVRARLVAMPGVEVHAVTGDGKLVVSIESDNDGSAVDTYKAIELLDGVLSVAMIFQQTESNPEQELPSCK
jgi:nitrate reductase NapD